MLVICEIQGTAAARTKLASLRALMPKVRSSLTMAAAAHRFKVLQKEKRQTRQREADEELGVSKVFECSC